MSEEIYNLHDVAVRQLARAEYEAELKAKINKMIDAVGGVTERTAHPEAQVYINALEDVLSLFKPKHDSAYNPYME